MLSASRLLLATGVSVALFCSQSPTALATTPQVAPSFRVETDLFEGENATPQSQHLILFDAGVVYDLPVGLGDIVTVFDIPRERVVLLHKTTRVRSSISTETLIQMAAQTRAAAEQAGAGESLGMNAKVASGVAPDSVVVDFGNSRYEATGQSVRNPAVAAEFSAFTSWAARLNIARHLGAPPFARITLAEHFANQNQLPRDLKLSVRQGFKSRTFRAQHMFVERLSDLDRTKITEVGSMLASYQEVEFSSFPTN